MTDAPAAPRGSAAQWLALAVVTLIAIALVVLLAEGTIRARQWFKHGTASSRDTMHTSDPASGLGRVLVPGWSDQRIRINAKGFRGPEIADPKPDGVVRLAFLGASTTFCAEVSGDDAVWPAIVTRRLQETHPKTRFDFVNGGVVGYSMASMRKNLAHKIAPLKPDVIVVYEATNDFSGEVRGMAVAAGLMDPPGAARGSWLERHSLLWELVVKNLRVMSAQRSSGESAGKLNADASKLGGEYAADLAALLREARAVTPHVAVASFSTRLRTGQSLDEQRAAAVSAFVYMPFMTIDGLLAGYRRYNEIIERTAAAESVLLIGGHDAIPGDAAHFVDTVHFTDAGSRAMADRVVKGLTGDSAIQALIRSRAVAP